MVVLKSCAVLRKLGRRTFLKTKSDLLLLLPTAAKSLLNKKSDGVKVSSCFPISLSEHLNRRQLLSQVPIPSQGETTALSCGWGYVQCILMKCGVGS